MTSAKELAEKIISKECLTLAEIEFLLETALEEHADHVASQMNEVYDKRVDQVVLAERERCAKIADSLLIHHRHSYSKDLNDTLCETGFGKTCLLEAIRQNDNVGAKRQPREEK